MSVSAAMHVFSNVGGRTDREQNKSFDARRRRIIIDRPRGRREFSPARDGGEVMQTGKNTKIHTHYTTYSPSTIETTKNIVINRTVTAQARWTEPSGSTSQLANNLPRTGMPPPPRPLRPPPPPMPPPRLVDLPPPGGGGVTSSSYVLSSTDVPSSVVLSSRGEEFRGMVVYVI